MPIDQQKALLFGAAAALRLLLFTAFPSLPDLLTGRVEISTPVTSFKRCIQSPNFPLHWSIALTIETVQEGLFLYTHNVSPYDGGVFHQVPLISPSHSKVIFPGQLLMNWIQAPLLLPLFSLLPNPSSHPFATNALYTLIDLLAAHALMTIASTGQSVSSYFFTSSRKDLRWSTVAIGASFLFNPFTILTCIARATSAISNLFILTAMAKAAQGKSFGFVFALSAASYLGMHPVLLFPPLVLLCYGVRAQNLQSQSPSKPFPNIWTFSITHFLGLSTAIGTLLALSFLLTSSWEFLPSTYGVRLLLPVLTPNVGLWWYFFTEMFDSFREFFLGVFWLHAASYTGGLTIRLWRQPLFVAVSLVGIAAVFGPYPSIADAGVYLSLVPVFRHLFPRKCNTFSFSRVGKVVWGCGWCFRDGVVEIMDSCDFFGFYADGWQ